MFVNILPKVMPNRMSSKLQVWNEEDAEDEVLAMVVRTGLCTSMGSMMRQVVYNAMPTRNRLLRVSCKHWATMSEHHLSSSTHCLLVCLFLYLFMYPIIYVFFVCFYYSRWLRKSTVVALVWCQHQSRISNSIP